MKRYNVTYFYLATGMEGRADTRDHGTIEANSADEARTIVAKRISRPEDVSWTKGCLTAVEVR